MLVVYGLGGAFGYIAAASAFYLLVTGIHVIYRMEHTTDLIDNAEGTSFGPDRIFRAREAFGSITEVVTSIYFLVAEVGFDDADDESSQLRPIWSVRLPSTCQFFTWRVDQQHQ